MAGTVPPFPRNEIRRPLRRGEAVGEMDIHKFGWACAVVAYCRLSLQ